MARFDTAGATRLLGHQARPWWEVGAGLAPLWLRREQKDAYRAARHGQRGRKGQCIRPVVPHHGTKWTW